LPQLQKDSTANIARRYRHLFRLPATNRTILLASIPVLAITVISRLVLRTAPIFLIASIPAAEVVLLISIELDRLVVKGRNKVANYRRLTSISIISNLFWLLLTFVGLIVYSLSGSETRFASLLILGAFFAISFRALIFGSLFFDRPWQGLPLALLQPILLFAPAAAGRRILLPQFIGSSSVLSSIVGGVICIIAIEAYLFVLNRSTSISNFKPLELLQAFLNAWAAEDAHNLERFLDATSKEGAIRTKLLSLSTSSAKDSNQTAMIVVPGVHPGPFYPIGSSNLPGDIYAKLHTNNLLPLTVHSISDHDLNLTSQNQVERYISSLGSPNIVGSGTKMSLPQTRTANKATVNGLAFDSSVLLTITQAPYGMEDFPTDVGKEVETYAQSKNFQNTLIIDTHNSEGEKPNESECEDAFAATREVIDSLVDSPQYEFRVGFAHSSELDAWYSPDVGPAGIGLILFEVGQSEEFTLVIVDSNNSVPGFREKIFETFRKQTNSRILELCTSDTHVTAAKTADAKGYLALGDVVSVDKLNNLLHILYEKANSRLAPGNFSSSTLTSNVKTIGNEVLKDFSGLIDATSSVAKNGARVLAILAFLITIVVAII